MLIGWLWQHIDQAVFCTTNLRGTACFEGTGQQRAGLCEGAAVSNPTGGSPNEGPGNTPCITQHTKGVELWRDPGDTKNKRTRSTKQKATQHINTIKGGGGKAGLATQARRGRD